MCRLYRWRIVAVPCLVTAFSLVGLATQADEAPLVPVTREEMKKVLEQSKKAKPRLPLPAADGQDSTNPGNRPVVNNGRMRQLYLPPELRGADFFRGPDPAMTLTGTFKTELFWIVSRANNCIYCLGHQEIKLASSGLSEDQIAALDLNWSQFSPAEQAAFAFTRQITLAPHTVNDDSIAELKKHFSESQVLEILFTVANNNATNRWTGGLAIPQEENGSALLRAVGQGATLRNFSTFLTPTSEQFAGRPSKVAPLGSVEPQQQSAPACLPPRPDSPSREEIETALTACRKRPPRLTLVEEAKARELLPDDWPKGPLPQYVRLLAHFPKAGPARVISLRAAAEKGALSPRLKAQIAWIAAREDRAWYALGHAKARLKTLGLDEQEIHTFDKDSTKLSPAERSAFALVRKLALSPALVTDSDVAELRTHFKDQEVAELIYHVCNAAFFNRLTEAAGLQLEDTE
ncbi:MAG: hypothetical protein NZM42_14300 [Gemmatales bacterium]|nr:hypothetical protein [Gemmatales bacterium]MDW8224295.1 hypothetical protein [Gemmatales bacterium]